jgi:GxxExxY protein
MASPSRENEISREIVDAAYKIHTTLGPGLLESVYETVLAHELTRRGLNVERQVPFPFVSKTSSSRSASVRTW